MLTDNSFKFKTKVQAPDGRMLSPYLKKLDIGTMHLMVDETTGPVEIGFLMIFDEHQALRLSGIENLSHTYAKNEQYKKVGTALMEYVLHESLCSHAGKITLDALRDSKAFFLRCGFQVNQADTEKEFGKKAESERNMWCMYLPNENIPSLQSKFTDRPVMADPKKYVLLSATVEQKSLIATRGGKIVAEESEKVSFLIDSTMLKGDAKGGIRDSLGMFRFATKENVATKHKIGLLKTKLPEITIEIEVKTEDKSVSYLITGDQKFYSSVATLMSAATSQDIKAWEDNVSKPILHGLEAQRNKELDLKKQHVEHQKEISEPLKIEFS